MEWQTNRVFLCLFVAIKRMNQTSKQPSYRLRQRNGLFVTQLGLIAVTEQA